MTAAITIAVSIAAGACWMERARRRRVAREWREFDDRSDWGGF